MFHISNIRTGTGSDDDDVSIAGPNFNLLSQFCIVDPWSANLANAMLCLGEKARAFHGLDLERDRFGLLEFVRCYDARRHGQIIELLEYAASGRRPFHFCAQLRHPRSDSRIVHCFGAYRAVEEMHSAEELFGVFLFSRDLYLSL